MRDYIKFVMQIFFAVCMLICWLIADWRQIAGLFAIALAITSVNVGGTDE